MPTNKLLVRHGLGPVVYQECENGRDVLVGADRVLTQPYSMFGCGVFFAETMGCSSTLTQYDLQLALTVQVRIVGCVLGKLVNRPSGLVYSLIPASCLFESVGDTAYLVGRIYSCTSTCSISYIHYIPTYIQGITNLTRDATRITSCDTLL